MSKRLIISEEEKNNIRSLHESYKNKSIVVEGIDIYEINMGIQCFLNTKKITDDSGQPLKLDGSIGTLQGGSKSAQAIAKYQKSIGVEDDGVWGMNTMDKMSKEDKMIFDNCKSNPEGSFLEKVGKFLHLTK